MGKKVLYNKDKKKRDGKNKSSAIFFAVFFGMWAWLYTIREDWKKLVFCFILIVVMSCISEIFMWITAIIVWGLVMYDTIRKPVEWYENYYR